MEENKKVLLSVRDLSVKFRVRGRMLTAIRGISLDIYENESIAIVGESGSGKSVFTKTFAGMLDSNGFVSNGSLIFDDDELSDITLPYGADAKSKVASLTEKLNEASRLEHGAATFKELLELESAEHKRGEVDAFDSEGLVAKLEEAKKSRVLLYNQRQTMDPKKEKDQIKKSRIALKEMDQEIKNLEKQIEKESKAAKARAKADTTAAAVFKQKSDALKAKHAEETKLDISAETKARNEVIAKEIYLSSYIYNGSRRNKLQYGLFEALKEAMKLGVDLSDENERNKVFESVTFRVSYVSESDNEIKGHRILNLAQVKFADDWTKIRGSKIATVFQDPMTSLNPIITIGKQISSVIMKHQGVSESEARLRALTLMDKVGIPNPAARYDDYPFQYSGGMRQRIVIAIALSCQPKILICDEPTTALDVTIQAQILQLIKDLQKEFNYTCVFITHDLGVVANIADRVAVVYAGQIVELGTVEDVFYDPRHPYTWALLSSLPQLAQRNTTLYSITGTPPSLYNEIKGDAFAPRNPYCLKVDTLAEPPMFKVSDTHYAKTWLLHPDAPKIEKPEGIQDIHAKLKKAFNID